nr:MAG TPA: hypothetical protein [Caudoviricetes sp.]
MKSRKIDLACPYMPAHYAISLVKFLDETNDPVFREILQHREKYIRYNYGDELYEPYLKLRTLGSFSKDDLAKLMDTYNNKCGIFLNGLKIDLKDFAIKTEGHSKNLCYKHIKHTIDTDDDKGTHRSFTYYSPNRDYEVIIGVNDVTFVAHDIYRHKESILCATVEQLGYTQVVTLSTKIDDGSFIQLYNTNDNNGSNIYIPMYAFDMIKWMISKFFGYRDSGTIRLFNTSRCITHDLIDMITGYQRIAAWTYKHTAISTICEDDSSDCILYPETQKEVVDKVDDILYDYFYHGINKNSKPTKDSFFYSNIIDVNFSDVSCWQHRDLTLFNLPTQGIPTNKKNAIIMLVGNDHPDNYKKDYYPTDKRIIMATLFGCDINEFMAFYQSDFKLSDDDNFIEVELYDDPNKELIRRIIGCMKEISQDHKDDGAYFVVTEKRIMYDNPKHFNNERR